MNRQYIGARYVPKFFEENNGEWLENRKYEALTIVQYMGNSYTSKKPVPANIGNPSENADYWVCTGNYNAQVEVYRKEVERLAEVYREEVERLVDSLTVVNFEDFYATTPQTFANVRAAIQYVLDNYDIVIFSGTRDYELDYIESGSVVHGALYLNVPKGTSVYGNGVTFTLKPNAYNNYWGIMCESDTYIENINVVGDKVAHTYDETTNEWGYGFHVAPEPLTQNASPNNITLINCSASMCTGDGFYVHADNVQLLGCKSFNNRRQGMSITTGSDIVVDNCEIYNIGTSDGVTGTMPKNGIDFENEGLLQNTIKAIVSNTYIHDCDGCNIEVTSATLANDITINNCVLESTAVGESYCIGGVCPTTVLRMANNIIIAHTDYGMTIMPKSIYCDGLDATVKSFVAFTNNNCTFKNVTVRHDASTAEVSREVFRYNVDNPQNLVFSNIVVEDSAVALLHDVDNLKSLANATITAQNITFRNPSVLPYTDTLVAAFYGRYKGYANATVVSMPVSTPDGNRFTLGSQLIANVPNSFSNIGIAAGSGEVEITSNNNVWNVKVISTCEGFGFTITPDGSVSATNDGAGRLRSGINYYNTDTAQFEHKA